MIVGRIDEVDGHFIATRFTALIVPTECVYIAPPNKRLTQANPNDNGIRIQTEWRSVALAYGRLWLPILAALVPLIVFLTTHTMPIVVVVLSVVMLSLSVVSYRTGELPEHEKARLRLLGTITGYRIDPSKLLPTMREVKRDSLGDLMEKGGIPINAAEILAVLDDIPMPAMPLVYGYACYVSDDPEWRACAHQVYLRHEQGDI